MSGKTCARCGKVVYPIEELKCLDKVWHKQCFKCQVCQMTLNMRNYKGFNKEPYCEAHIPKAKATTVAETPELKRIAENTKIQSNVKYHADFERAKGKFTQVADDPETLRIKENSKNISNVAYHGDLQKKADMERQRNISDADGAGSADGSNGEYHVSTMPLQQHHQHHHQGRSSSQHPVDHRDQPPAVHYSKMSSSAGPGDGSNGGYPAPAMPHQQHHQQHQQHQQQQGRSSSQHAVDHRDLPPAVHHSRMPSTLIYTSDGGAVNEPSNRRVGSIHDLDPVNDFYGSLSNEGHGQMSSYPQYQPPPQRYYPPAQESVQSKYTAPQADPMGNRRDGGYVMNGRMPQGGQQRGYQEYSDPPPPPHQPRNSGRVFRAMYEYNAQDADEVSFLEGDFIVNCTPIDEGWLSGVVQRTGRKGMLPANYVSPAI